MRTTYHLDENDLREILKDHFKQVRGVIITQTVFIVTRADKDDPRGLHGDQISVDVSE